MTEIIAAYDIDEQAVQTYNQNWPAVAKVDDLKLWRQLEIPDCDGIIAGPPCQDASSAGRRSREGQKRGLNQLYVETAMIVDHKRPAWAIIENVQLMRNEPEFHVANNILWNAGYWTTLVELIHADYGGLTTRNRMFLMASRRMLLTPTPTQAIWRAHGPALEPLLKQREPDGWGRWNLDKARISTCTSENATFGANWGGQGPTWRAWDTPYFTITASWWARDKARFDGQVYMLNAQERGVLQGFPSDYKGLTHHQGGNAVPPEYARMFGKMIRGVYGKRQQVVSLFCGAGGFDFIQDAS